MRVLFAARINFLDYGDFNYMFSVNGIDWSAIRDIKQWATNDTDQNDCGMNDGISNDLTSVIRYLILRRELHRLDPTL